MTGGSSPSPLIPEARDDDDDDVAWALQTAAVQWKRGGRAEAVSWLRRAAEAAVEAGVYARARELNSAAVSLEHASRLFGEEDGEDYDGAEPILEVSEEVIVEVSDDEPDDARSELPTLSDLSYDRGPSRPVPRAAPPPVRVLRPPPKVGVPPPLRRPSGPGRVADEGLSPAFPAVGSRGSGPPSTARGPGLVNLGLPDLPAPPSVRGLSSARPNAPETPYERTSSQSAEVRPRGGVALPPLPSPPSSTRSARAPESRPRLSRDMGLADEPPAVEPESTTGSGRGRRAVWSFTEVEAVPPSEPLERPAIRSKPTWSFAPAESDAPPPSSESVGRPRSEPGWMFPTRTRESEPTPESFRGSDLPVSVSDSFAPNASSAPPDAQIESLAALPQSATEQLSEEAQRFGAPYREKAPSAEELDLADAEELPIADDETGDRSDAAVPAERGSMSSDVLALEVARALGPLEGRSPAPVPEPASFGDEPTAPRDPSVRAAVLEVLSEAHGAPAAESASALSNERRSPELRAQLLCPRVPELEHRNSPVPSVSATGGEPGRRQGPSASTFATSADAPGVRASAESTQPSQWGEAPAGAGLRRAPSQAPGELGEPSVGGIRLADVRGLQDLPEDSQRRLAATVRVETLAAGEEVGFFAVALVLRGWVRIMPAVTDTPCARATAGQVVFTTGTIEEGLDLCVRAGEDEATVAVWDRGALEQATADCPWVGDELRLVADGFQALAGAAMGRLGDRLDESLRSMVTERCDVRTLRPGEIVAEQGQRVPGMYIVGAGRLQLVSEHGSVESEVGPGEFLFAAQVLSAGPAPKTARAGALGALVLVAERKVTHELVTSVPPLLELLAEE